MPKYLKIKYFGTNSKQTVNNLKQNKMTYIGKKYKIGDRSYMHNLSTDLREELTRGAETMIVKDPYKHLVRDKFTHTFVDVLYNNEVIRAMFNKENVIEEPKGITADTFVEIGKMFESCFKTCEGDKKESLIEVDILREELKQIREEVNQLKEDELTWTHKEAEKFKDLSFLNGKTVKFVDIDKLKIKKEIERRLSDTQRKYKESNIEIERYTLRGRIEALNWVLGKH